MNEPAKQLKTGGQVVDLATRQLRKTLFGSGWSAWREGQTRTTFKGDPVEYNFHYLEIPIHIGDPAFDDKLDIIKNLLVKEARIPGGSIEISSTHTHTDVRILNGDFEKLKENLNPLDAGKLANKGQGRF